MPSGRIISIILCILLLANPAVAAAQPESPTTARVVSVQQPEFAARLLEVNDGGLLFRTADQEKKPLQIARENFVRWSHPVQPRPHPQVLLADGSLLVGAPGWAGQGIVQFGAENLQLATTLFGQVEVSRRYVRGLLVQSPHDATARQRVLDAIADHDAPHDLVMLMGGDRLEGTALSLEEGELRIQVDARELVVPDQRVAAIAFDPRLLDKSTPPSSHRLAVSLTDGSLLLATDVRADVVRCELTLWQDFELAARSVADIAALQSLGSARFAYLSDFEPADFRHVAYLDLSWPLAADRGLQGGPLQANGAIYLKGLAMHSAARATWRLDGNYDRFAAQIALSDDAGRRGSVVFRIYCARDGSWQEVFESDILRGGDPPQFVEADLSGAQALTLVVDYADRGDELDHALWLDARLVK